MRNLVVASLLLAMALASSEASADPPPFFSDPRFFPVLLEPSEPAAKVEVQRIGESGVLGTCVGACYLPLGPGRYLVRVTEESGKSSKDAITIGAPQRLVLQSPNRSAKYGGLALGIVGTTLAGFGGLLTLVCLAHHTCSDNKEYPYLFPAVVTVAIVGAIAAPIGWVIFSKNRKLHIAPGPLLKSPDDPPASGPSISLGLIQTPGGALVAGGIAF